MLNGQAGLIIAGTGGQGILLAGTVLAQTAMSEGKSVTCIPSYGAERRGGLSYCIVVISNKEIYSPVIAFSDCLIGLDKIGFDLYENSVKENGVIIINTSLVKKKTTRKDVDVIDIPACDLAEQVGDIRTTNMVVVGAYIEKMKVVSLDNAIDSLEKVVSKRHSELIKLNGLALRKGAEFIRDMVHDLSEPCP